MDPMVETTQQQSTEDAAPPNELLDLTVIVPTLNEQGNIGELVTRASQLLDGLGLRYEILIADGNSTDGTVAEALNAGARALLNCTSGYGGALRAGFDAARGEYLLTMDSDLSHEPEFIETLWERRKQADITIASRYVRGGAADMAITRAILSRILNIVFTMLLQIPVKDISSGFRIYRRKAVEQITFDAVDFDVLEEILIKLYIKGFRVAEAPFHYRPRKEGKSHAKLFKFAIAYLRTLFSMSRLRWSRRS